LWVRVPPNPSLKKPVEPLKHKLYGFFRFNMRRQAETRKTMEKGNFLAANWQRIGSKTGGVDSISPKIKPSPFKFIPKNQRPSPSKGVGRFKKSNQPVLTPCAWHGCSKKLSRLGQPLRIVPAAWSVQDLLLGNVEAGSNGGGRDSGHG
jgi:hypothetical protein